MDIKEIERIIDYHFGDSGLLAVAFTHSSLAHEQNIKSNERLEFLGDSILNMIASRHLYDSHSDTEGIMTEKRKSIVSMKPLSDAIDKLDLSKFLQLGRNTKEVSSNMKADLFEAIVAAIYLDGGIEPAGRFIMKSLCLCT